MLLNNQPFYLINSASAICNYFTPFETRARTLAHINYSPSFDIQNVPANMWFIKFKAAPLSTYSSNRYLPNIFFFHRVFNTFRCRELSRLLFDIVIRTRVWEFAFGSMTYFMSENLVFRPLSLFFLQKNTTAHLQ